MFIITNQMKAIKLRFDNQTMVSRIIVTNQEIRQWEDISFIEFDRKYTLNVQVHPA